MYTYICIYIYYVRRYDMTQHNKELRTVINK